jgi:hypothetical protein
MGNRFREKVVEEGLEAEEPRRETSVSEASVPEASDEAQNSTSPQEESKPKKGGKAARGIGKVLGGDMLADKFVLRQIPLLLLCLVYLLLIVGNRYRVESLSREKAATEERINFLREHRIQMQKQYQQSVKISQIAEELKENGVGITSGPPYEI